MIPTTATTRIIEEARLSTRVGPRNNSTNRGAKLESNLSAHPHPHQPQRRNILTGDAMHVMLGESLSYLLPAALRVALRLPVVAAGG